MRTTIRAWPAMGALLLAACSSPQSPPTISSLDVTLASGTVATGATTTATATAKFSDGTRSDVTTVATWASSDSSVAYVACDASPCVVTTVAAGSATLTASYGGLTGSAGLTVTAASLKSITVNAPETTVAIGTSTNLDAIGLFSDGSSQDVTSQVSWSSSMSSVAKVLTTGVVTGVSVGTATLTASLSGLSGTTSVTVVAALPVALALTPNPVSLSNGLSAQLSAEVTFTDDSLQNLAEVADWTSSDTTVAAVSVSGLVIALAPGTATITATVDGLQATDVVTVTAAAISQVAITPASPSLAAGLTRQLHAEAGLTNGQAQDVTATATWVTTDPSVATVSTSGLLTAVGAGTCTITATYATVQGSDTVTVTSAAPTSLTVSAPQDSIPAGLSVQLTAEAPLTDGTSADLAGSVTWSSTDTTGSIATVSSTGLLTAVGPGAVTVTATTGSFSSSVQLTITAGISSLALDVLSDSLPIGLSEKVIALATLTGGSTLDVTPLASWTTSDTTGAILTVSAAGLVTAVGAGTASVTATVGGATALAQFNVVHAVSSIAVTPAAPSVPVGSTVQLDVMATLTDSTTLDVTAWATWTSTDTAGAIATVSPEGLVTGVAQSNTTVTLTATVSGETATSVVTVVAPVITGIAVTPTPISLPVGLTQQLDAMATYSDNSMMDVTSTVTWTSADTTGTIATVSTGGLVTAVGVSATAVQITATAGSISGFALVTVVAPVLHEITISPTDPTVSVGETLQFDASGTNSDGSPAPDQTSAVRWSTTDGTVAAFETSGTPGLLTCVMAGTVTVTASIADPQSTTGGQLTDTTTVQCM